MERSNGWKDHLREGHEPWMGSDWQRDEWDHPRNGEPRGPPPRPPGPRISPGLEGLERMYRDDAVGQHARGRGGAFDGRPDGREALDRPGMDDDFQPREHDDFAGRGRPEFRGRGRGDFGGRGRGDFDGRPHEPFIGRGGPDLRGRGEYPRGRGFGRFGRGGWNEDGPFPGRGRGFADGGREEFGGFRGRGEYFGRGFRGRGRFDGRGRGEWQEGGPRQPNIDPALLERRRASNAALLKHQVGQLQVSADLLGNDESAELYNKIVEGSMKPRQDLRSLYTYPLFSADDNGLVVSNLEDASDQSQAFEQCLLMYQEAQSSHVVVSSDHGNFLLSSADCV